ncbi:MAG: hypothetical protein IBJ03_04395 [Gemmatimonadaceae bacterium]|nr:hypothetical protein [Gemmatimonadaceae bacterium]
MLKTFPTLFNSMRKGLVATSTGLALTLIGGTPLALWGQGATPVGLSNNTPVSATSIARTDSTTPAPQPARRTALFGNSGFYLSLGGGSSLPSLELNDRGYEPGFNLHMPIGYQRPNQLLGVRLDLGYSRLGSNQSVVAYNGQGQVLGLPANRPQIYSATLNMTARGQIGAVGVYGVGGGGIYRFHSFGQRTPIGEELVDESEMQPVENSNGNRLRRNAFGAQVGAGMEFGIGAAAVFVESRLVNVFGNTQDFLSSQERLRDRNAIRWVPISVGITLR